MQEQFIQLVPKHLQDHFKETIEKYSINTVFRCGHFLSEVMHESDDFKHKEENLNYSENGLLLTFPKYFNAETARTYARKPEQIANRIYANRMGNGNEQSGDGWRYKGRGFIQLTGKANYESLYLESDINFIQHPEKLAEDRFAMLSAGWYWDMRKINLVADRGFTDDVIKDVTRKINGGLIGITDRTEKLNMICNKLQMHI